MESPRRRLSCRRRLEPSALCRIRLRPPTRRWLQSGSPIPRRESFCLAESAHVATFRRSSKPIWSPPDPEASATVMAVGSHVNQLMKLLNARSEFNPVEFAKAAKVLVQSRPDPLLRLRGGHDRRRVVDRLRQLRVLDHLREQQRPRARHDFADRVAPSPERQPPPLAQLVRELMEGGADTRPDARRGSKMRERVEVMRVAAVLSHQYRRLEPSQQCRNDLFERQKPRLVPRVRNKRHVGGESLSRTNAAVLRKAGAGKQPVARFVQADGQNVRIALKDVLDAVAVVNVDVDVGDAMAALDRKSTRL